MSHPRITDNPTLHWVHRACATARFGDTDYTPGPAGDGAHGCCDCGHPAPEGVLVGADFDRSPAHTLACRGKHP